MSDSGFCFRCAHVLTVFDYGRQDTCPHCKANTHCCKNCVFYDPALHNECREPQADRVVDKEAGNFCDYFKPSPTMPKSTHQAAVDLKAVAESLFKKK